MTPGLWETDFLAHMMTAIKWSTANIIAFTSAFPTRSISGRCLGFTQTARHGFRVPAAVAPIFRDYVAVSTRAGMTFLLAHMVATG